MTEEQFLSLCKPGVTLEDFKPVKLEETPQLLNRLEESRQRQLKILRQKNAPLENLRITI
jgi:hypothetical protein